MNNETTENDFLKSLNESENDQFKEDELFGGSSEPEVEETPEEEDKPLPFHKDPKVQRYIQKELDKKLKDLQSNERQSTERQFLEETKADADEGTLILERIIGNDTPEKVQAVRDFKRYLSSLEEKGAQKALEQLEYQAVLEKQEEAQATAEIEQGFEDIEENFNVDLSSNSPQARKTRNEFIDFIKRIAPKDDEGGIVALPDLVETFDLYQSTRPKQSNTRAKELASRSMTRSTSAPEGSQPRDSSWKAVDKWLSNLTK